MDRSSFRSQVLSRHFKNQAQQQQHSLVLQPSTCLDYYSPDISEPIIGFDTHQMRKLMDGHHLEERDWVYSLMIQSGMFVRKEKGGRAFALPDYNQTMEQQRVMTMKRIEYLVANGVFDGFLITKGPTDEFCWYL